MNENKIAKRVVHCAFQIHSELGPGLLKSVYEILLAHLLLAEGLRVSRQKAIPITFRGLRFEEGFRADIIVDDLVLVEFKSIEALANVHKKRTLTYLRLMGLRLGLLINFNTPLIKNGIVRVADGMPE